MPCIAQVSKAPVTNEKDDIFSGLQKFNHVYVSATVD